VAAIIEGGGHVAYEFDYTHPGHWTRIAAQNKGELPGPDWLCRLIGLDYFDHVVYVDWPNATDEGLAPVGQLTMLEYLNVGGTQITDEGLAHLAGLNKLQLLDLNRTWISDAGLVHLRDMTQLKALNLYGTQTRAENHRGHVLPKCRIRWGNGSTSTGGLQNGIDGGQ
jgi:hypothetical protein